MRDIMGTALLDYFEGNYTEDLITWTNITEDDELPLPYLFRSFEEMSSLERLALKMTQGKVLDVGCGAGVHSLWLKEKGLEVTSIDISKGATEVCRRQGLEDVRNINLLDLKDEKFDTILLLMNGTGIFRNLESLPKYLQHLKSLLSENGQILIDSTDLIYMYEDQEDGSLMIPAEHYYGEVQFGMSYKGAFSEPFDWLYLNEDIFEDYCDAEDLNFEVLDRGGHFDYLARIQIYK